MPYFSGTREENVGEPAARLRLGLTTRQSQPLIGTPTIEGSEEVVRYFASEEDADRALAGDHSSVERVLGLIGA